MRVRPPEIAAAHRTGTVLRLLVRNHPGVMSHVCGLFARRAFNVEGILCLPVGDAARSVVLLLVNADQRIEQLVRQLEKLEDVLAVRRDARGHAAFAAAAPHLRSRGPTVRRTGPARPSGLTFHPRLRDR
jgi:acetolactate synthase I/III small subunit